jgi:hypothetical protein
MSNQEPRRGTPRDGASATTRERTLTSTWESGGTGQYGYTVTDRELKARKIGFFDSTIDGHLLGLDRLTLDEVQQLGTHAG